MPTDLDSLLLDRLFQPASDIAARWTSCFGLARLFLLAAALLQFVVLAGDLQDFAHPLARFAVGATTVLALFGAQQGWALITRAERQARPGGMNLRRITLRWQRLAWVAVTLWAVASGIGSPGLAGLGLSAACVAWLGLIYFVSCTPAPPPARTAGLRFASELA